MNEKMQPNHPEKMQPLIDRIPMDEPKYFSHQEMMQIHKELKEREGKVRAELEALNAYLSGQWDPEKIAEKYPEAAKKGYDFPPEAFFQLPSKNVRINPVGEVGSRALKRVRDKSKGTTDDWRQLTWDYNLYRPKVQEYAENAEKLSKLIEAAESAELQVPASVKVHLEKIQKEKEELDQAFERGKHFTDIFTRTNLEVHFSSPTAPEEIELDVQLKYKGNPIETTEIDPETQKMDILLSDYYYGELPGIENIDRSEYPKFDYQNWRVDISEFGYKNCAVLNAEKIADQKYRLTIGGSFSGDEFSSSQIGGNIVIDMTTDKIIEGKLIYESGYTDGDFKAEYTFKQ